MAELSNFSTTSDYLDSFYNVDIDLVKSIENVLNLACLPTIPSNARLFEIKNERHHFSKIMLNGINSKLKMINENSKYYEWLSNRKISPLPDISATDMCEFSDDELLSLRIIPDDHIIEDFGYRPVDGVIFKDIRNKQLMGLCVRNCTTDLDFVSRAKYSFTNQDYFLYGVDDVIDPEGEVCIVEGVFDAIALRKIGKQAVAIGSSHASSRQLAFIIENYPRTTVCFDNDVYGMAGAIQASLILGSNIIFSNLKDPYEEVINGSSKFKEMSMSVLILIVQGMVANMKPIKDPIRDLRYNKK